MRLSRVFLLTILLAAGAVASRAQVFPSASTHQISITAGGTVSAFQPDFAGIWACSVTALAESCPSDNYVPVAQTSAQRLFGVGTYVDVKLTRWVQLEAEGRWQRFHAYGGITQDNYLIGPRLPVYRFWKATVYGKALGGMAKMNFDSYGDHGTFTALAFGGGMDVKLTRKISIRAFDAEYQYWPAWGNSTLSPYGVSAGVGYRIF